MKYEVVLKEWKTDEAGVHLWFTDASQVDDLLFVLKRSKRKPAVYIKFRQEGGNHENYSNSADCAWN